MLVLTLIFFRKDTRFPGMSARLKLTDVIAILQQGIGGIWPNTRNPSFTLDLPGAVAFLVSIRLEFGVRFDGFLCPESSS